MPGVGVFRYSIVYKTLTN